MRIKTKLKKPNLRLATLAALIAMALAPAMSQAQSASSLICERTSSTCLDSNTRYNYYVGEGYFTVPTPTGYNNQSCWKWYNSYDCIDRNPTHTCTGAAVGVNVLSECAQVGGSIGTTKTLNNVQYITDGTYSFLCEFPKVANFTPPLPEGKECVLLETRTFYTESVAADVNQVVGDNYIIGSTPETLDRRTLGYKSNTATSVSGNPATVKALTGSIFTQRKIDTEFVCYDPPVEVCTDSCYTENSTASPAEGSSSNIAITEQSCSVPKSDCVLLTTFCDGNLDPNTSNPANATNSALGPDGRCVEQNNYYQCASSSAPACNTDENCTLKESVWSNVSDNGLPMAMEQTYECSISETQCEKVNNVSSCATPQAWGLDKMSYTETIGEGMGEANTAMAKVEGIQKGMSEDDVFIFSGQDLRCRYPVGNFLDTFIVIGAAVLSGGTSLVVTAAAAIALASDLPNSKAFGKNCCEEYIIEGSDSFFEFGQCKASEVKLAVARSKELVHKIGGDYCSKKSKLTRSCKQKTKTYCAFDDMLALTVNLEGRKQLDLIASANYSSATSTTATSNAMAVSRLAPVATPVAGKQYAGLNNGRWAKITTYNGTDIYNWQYPAYCYSRETQKAAYTKYVADVDAALSMKGYIPAKDEDGNYLIEKLTDAQKVEILNTIANAPQFQECSSLPGSMAFMSCSTGTTCDISKAPLGPEGIEYSDEGRIIGATYDANGNILSGQPDVNWRIQEVRSFYALDSYGVSGTVPLNGVAYPKVSNSISENITVNGSCLELSATGNCAYTFSVTAGEANRRMLTETVQFPLYSLSATEEYPTIDYMPATGTFNQADYMADINRGRGSPLEFGKQRFIFHPNLATKAPNTGIHENVLMEWAYRVNNYDVPPDDYVPIALPTYLPEGTSGWWPRTQTRFVSVATGEGISEQLTRECYNIKNNYENNTSGHDSMNLGSYNVAFYNFRQVHKEYDENCQYRGAGYRTEDVNFYISGECNEQTKWCEYTIKHELKVERHPWGTNKSPRCWGFSLDQMAVLDFDAMDLSRWINSLDLGELSNGVPDATKSAMASQVTSSAQNFYSAMSSGNTVATNAAENQALVLSDDTLPNVSKPAFQSYLLHASVPSNWPKYNEGGVNDNPVLGATVNFGREGVPDVTMELASDGKSFKASADMGNYPVNTYKVVVKVQTKNSGEQVLAQYVRVTPYYGAQPTKTPLDFGNDNLNAKSVETYEVPGIKDKDGNAVNPLDTLLQNQGTSVNPAQP